jgi:hypothetical protein
VLLQTEELLLEEEESLKGLGMVVKEGNYSEVVFQFSLLLLSFHQLPFKLLPFSDPNLHLLLNHSSSSN